MKLKSLLLAVAFAGSLSQANAQITWDANSWGYDNTAYNELSVSEDGTTLIDKIKEGKTRGDIRNSTPLTYSPTEGYVIMKFKAHGLTMKALKMQIYYELQEAGTTTSKFNGEKVAMTYKQADDDTDTYYAYYNYQANGYAKDNGITTKASEYFTEKAYTLNGGSSFVSGENSTAVKSWMAFVMEITTAVQSETYGNVYFEILNLCTAQQNDVEAGGSDNILSNVKAIADGSFVPAVVNETTGIHYADLTTAWASIADGDVLVVNTDQTTNGCLSVPNDVAVTVRGAEGKNITITRGSTNAMMFLANKGETCKLTLENLTLDGNSATATDCNLIEASGNSTVTYNNVAIKNAKSSNGIGLIVAKSNGKVAINGLSFDDNCETLDNNSRLVFIGAAGSSISGNNQLTMTIEKTYNIAVTAELTNESPIAVKSYNDSFVSGNTVFTGSTATSKFSLVGVDGLRLLAKDGNIVFSDQEGIALRNADEYDDFMTAWNDAQSGDVVTLKGDVSVAGTLNGNKRNITLRGNKAAAKVIRKDADGSETTDNETTAVTITRTGTGLLILANQGETVTVEDVVIDGGNLESTNNLIEASSNSTVALSDVTVQNAKSSNSLGLIVAKGGGKLVLTDVATTDCTVNDATGTVFAGNTSTVTLSGDNQISISVESGATLSVGDLTNDTAIMLYSYGDNFTNATITTSDNSTVDTSKFSVEGGDLKLTTNSDGSVTLEDLTPAGIANVEADAADAPVEYYNLQGQRVANPTNGVFLRKQGATVTKVRI
jgi:hypothetical protein